MRCGSAVAPSNGSIRHESWTFSDRNGTIGMIGLSERSVMRVKDVMTVDVVTVTPETSLRDAAAELSRRRVSGMPVVDDDGRVIGVISEADVLAKEQSAPDQPAGAIARLLKRDESDDPSRFGAVTVGEAMTKPAVSVEPQWPVAVAADKMLEGGVNRLPVVQQGRLIGIVTRADLVRAFARSDEQIVSDAREIVALQQELWRDSRPIDVTIDGGEVTLTGDLRSRGEAAVLGEMVRTVPGVVNVRSALTWSEEDKPIPAEGARGASRAHGFPPPS
jgi:CBS domain-containing protein